MTSLKNNLLAYLVPEYTHLFNPTPGILAVLEGDFSRLPELPSHDDWHALALMINGWDLSEKIGYGRMNEYVSKCLAKYFNSGELPKKSIELWICLNMMQRSENLSGYPERLLRKSCTRYLWWITKKPFSSKWTQGIGG